MELVDASAVFKADFPWEPMQIMPIGDIQYDGPDGATDVDRLRRHLAWGVKHNVWFIGTGDIVDFLSPSNRVNLMKAGLYDTAMGTIEEAATRLEKEVFEILEPTKGRWIGLVQGHHYYEHSDGTTSDTRIAEWLGTRFLGDCALIRFNFKEGKGHRSKSIKMWIHHGAGGGGNLPTAIYNKMYHQISRYPTVRLFLQGHVPQLGHVNVEGLDMTDSRNPHLIHEDRHLIACGGFSRSYKQGSRRNGRAQGGYAEKAMMPPAVLGGALITLTPERFERKGVEYITIDVKVST